MARDNAPIGNTCPIIDRVLGLISDLYNNTTDDEQSEKDYKAAKDYLEEIRSANATLREWGNELFYKCDELEKDLDNANNDIDSLKDKLQDLQRELDLETN